MTASQDFVLAQPNIAKVSALIGEPARAKMLLALMGGKALTATELALEGAITSQTASSHLAKMLDSQLLVVQKQGRHKYFQLSSLEVAELLEALLNISAKVEHSKVQTGPQDPQLRKSRICYDHLAGELGVSLFDSLKSNQYITMQDSKLSLRAAGQDFFNARGADLTQLMQRRRPLCKNCLDWSERRHHLAGSLGQWILTDIMNQGWATKALDSRVLHFSDKGLRQLVKTYGLEAKA